MRMKQTKELYQQGKNVTEISKHLGVSRKTIYNYFEEIGEEIRELEPDPVDDLYRDIERLEGNIDRIQREIDGTEEVNQLCMLIDKQRILIKEKQGLKERFNIIQAGGYGPIHIEQTEEERKSNEKFIKEMYSLLE